MAGQGGRAEVLLLSAIFLAMVAFGMTLPLFPFLVDSFGGGGLQMGLLIAVYGLLQLFFAPLWGRTSDRIGRRPLLLLGTAGLVGALVIYGLATNLAMLFVGQAVLGSLTSALFPVATAAMSDLHEGDSRTGAIGRIGAATGLGVVVGPGIGGLLAFDSLSLPFLIAACGAALVLVAMGVLLPETHRQRFEHREERAAKALVPGGRLRLPLAALRPLFLGLAMVFTVYFGKSLFSAIFSFYAMERFAYGTMEVGSLLMIMGIVYAVSQGALVGPAVKHFGSWWVMRAGLAGSALGFIALLAAESYLTLALAIVLLIVSNATLKPTALAYIADRSEGAHGRALGFADVFMSLGRIIGPIYAGVVYEVGIELPFVSGALFFALALTSLMLSGMHQPRPPISSP